MTEGFLEHMSLEEALVGIEDLIKGLPCLAPDVGLSGKEDELLAGQDMPEPFRRPPQLGDPDLVERLQEMPDHVELVVDDLYVRAMGLEALSEGLPHIHGGMGDEARPLLAKPSPSLFHSLLLIFLFFRRSNHPLPFCKSKKVKIVKFLFCEFNAFLNCIDKYIKQENNWIK